MTYAKVTLVRGSYVFFRAMWKHETNKPCWIVIPAGVPVRVGRCMRIGACVCRIQKLSHGTL